MKNKFGDPEGTRYGHVVDWGGRRVEVSDCGSPDEAYAEAVVAAVLCGWTRPRWWEVWRKDLDLERVMKWLSANRRRKGATNG